MNEQWGAYAHHQVHVVENPETCNSTPDAVAPAHNAQTSPPPSGIPICVCIVRPADGVCCNEVGGGQEEEETAGTKTQSHVIIALM